MVSNTTVNHAQSGHATSTSCHQLTTVGAEWIISPTAHTVGKQHTKTLKSDKFMRIFTSYGQI
jgi:hypothetical protein